MNLDKPGKYPIDTPILTAHSGPVLDFDFNPFHDGIIATGSDDTTIKIWGIPDGGLTQNITAPLVDINAHNKKVTLLQFHPTASNVLASASADPNVKVWDIEKGMDLNTCEHPDLIQDVAWDYTGAQYATSCKDKNVRIVDGRTGNVSTVLETVNEGAKSTKLTFLGNSNQLLTVGFTKQSQRQFKVFDVRNSTTAVAKVDIDQAAGVILPFFDPDTNILFLAGKGDGNIRYYEMVNQAPYAFPLADFRSSVSAKGVAMVPKRGLNVMSCEIARAMKLTTNSVAPISFYVPRKSDAFQEDLYPDTKSSEPSHTADQWLAGSDLPPKLVPINPNEKESVVEKKSATFTAPKSIPVLTAELDAANQRIKYLEDKLKAAGVSY